MTPDFFLFPPESALNEKHLANKMRFLLSLCDPERQIPSDALTQEERLPFITRTAKHIIQQLRCSRPGTGSPRVSLTAATTPIQSDGRLWWHKTRSWVQATWPRLVPSSILLCLGSYEYTGSQPGLLGPNDPGMAR